VPANVWCAPLRTSAEVRIPPQTEGNVRRKRRTPGARAVAEDGVFLRHGVAFNPHLDSTSARSGNLTGHRWAKVAAPIAATVSNPADRREVHAMNAENVRNRRRIGGRDGIKSASNRAVIGPTGQRTER